MTYHCATPSCSRKMGQSTKPVKKKLRMKIRDIEEIIHEDIREWLSDLSKLPLVNHAKILE